MRGERSATEHRYPLGCFNLTLCASPIAQQDPFAITQVSGDHGRNKTLAADLVDSRHPHESHQARLVNCELQPVIQRPKVVRRTRHSAPPAQIDKDWDLANPSRSAHNVDEDLPMRGAIVHGRKQPWMRFAPSEHAVTRTTSNALPPTMTVGFAFRMSIIRSPPSRPPIFFRACSRSNPFKILAYAHMNWAYRK